MVGILILTCLDQHVRDIKIQYIHIHLALHMLAGILPSPQQIGMNISNNTLSLSWVALNSHQVSHYALYNKCTKMFNNPTTCNPLKSYNYSLDLTDPFFFTCHGGKNTTILNYKCTTLFTFFAVNGAGNGNSYSYICGAKWKADRLG